MTQAGVSRSPPSSRRPLAIVRSIAALRTQVAQWRRGGASIGAVPTMGGLHEGHLELVRRAQGDCERVVVTLFVNPMQFNNAADLASYPSDEAADAAALERLGVDLLFAPPVEEIYPEGFATKVTVAQLTDCLCGISRPGHFDGVATVVAKLLGQLQADAAYFGEKDFQQLLVVQRLTRDLDIPVRIVGVPTVRDADGVALSSRNVLLSTAQRAQAPLLYRVLSEIAGKLAAGAPAAPLLEAGRAALTAGGFERIDYLELRSADELELLERADRPARVFAAAWLGQVRLIDNVPVT
ncbi:MAG: pantoate--beta-alanine ligase [Kiloniellales bacterium]